MRKLFEWIAFNFWLAAVTGASCGVFWLLARAIKAQQFEESVEGWLLWAVCVPAAVAAWYWVGSRSMTQIERHLTKR